MAKKNVAPESILSCEQIAEYPNADFNDEFSMIEIISEVHLHMTFKGYCPVVLIKQNDTVKKMYMTASSLGKALEPRRIKNNNLFTGIKVNVRKESMEKMARYIVADVDEE